MPDLPIHVVDFEGTRESGVLEYGVVTLRDGQIESARTRLCGATGRISEQDRRQHGLSGSRLSGLKPFTEDWDYFAGLRQSGPFCAHSAAVEDGLLCAVWPYARRSPDFGREGGTVLTWGPWIDTLQLYRRLYPGLESHKLADLIERFGLAGSLAAQAGLHCPVNRARYHCALYDSLASALLLLRLFDEPGLRDQSMHWWLLESTASGGNREAREQGDLFG